MGIGDEIMATGEVKRRAAGSARVFAIFSPKKNVHRFHDLWFGNPRIAQPGEPFDERLDNAGGCRPYIVAKGDRAWVWRAYKPEPGEVFLTQSERALAKLGEGRVIVNPNLKPTASPNKLWSEWQRLIDRAPHVPWLQVGEPGARQLGGVPFVATRSFREACGVLSGARGAVLHEGGFHHAAAAFAVPAVVIFGGYIGPKVTGYTTHRNLFDETEQHPLGCGMRVPCHHCVRAMAKITTKQIKHELEAIL